MSRPPITEMDPKALDPEVETALGGLDLDPDRPLIISDADEVLLQFVAGLERFLDTKDLWLDLKSFALSGNIKRKGTNEPFPKEETQSLLGDFFKSETEKLEAVPHAAESLAALSDRAQIIVLSNVPTSQQAARSSSLASQGMDYPLIANKGLKGGAVAHIGATHKAPIFFLDDIPHNVWSVAAAYEPSKRLHFIADKRLARLIDASEHSHFHSSHWPDARAFIEDELTAAGY